MEFDESVRDELLAEVEAVAPILTEHAPQSEKLGRLDEPTVEALRKTRLLRFICPRELGGCEADPITAMEVLEAVARIENATEPAPSQQRPARSRTSNAPAPHRRAST